MLKQIIKELAGDRFQSYTQLARRLDISEGMLAQLIEDLARRGYLAPVETTAGCGVACGSCGGGSGACTPQVSCAHCSLAKPKPTATKSWTLTQKGRRLAETPAPAGS
jgi:hypothetical protein